jgi:hypothetical protein
MHIFLCGFTFSILTLLVINLPDPNTLAAQLILLFLTVMFDLLLYLILLISVEALQFCRNVPEYGKRLRHCSSLSNTALTLWGFSVPSVFLLWNIVSLAVLSALIWVVFIVISNFTIRKPFLRYRATADLNQKDT